MMTKPLPEAFSRSSVEAELCIEAAFFTSRGCETVFCTMTSPVDTKDFLHAFGLPMRR